MSWPEPTSTRDLEVPLFPHWTSRQLKYNFGFPKNVDSRTEPLRLDLIRPGTTKVLWRICPEASDPPVVAHRRRRHFRGNGLRSRRRHAREEIKGGDENFLRLSRRSTAGCRDVYSSFNHTLGLWRGSTASLEDLRALYHVATHRKWGCQPGVWQEVWTRPAFERAGMRCVCLALPAIIPSLRSRWCKMSARE